MKTSLMVHMALRQSVVSGSGLALPMLQDVETERGISQVAKYSAARPLEFTLIETMAELEQLAPEWQALFDQHARPEQVFQSFGWIWHWARHYLGRRTRLAVLTGRSGGRLVLIFPLSVTRKAGLVHLGWAGEPVSQYGDVLVVPEASDIATLEAAWREVVRQTGADLANIRKARADAVVTPLLEALGARITCTEEAPYVDLDKRAPDYARFDETLPAKNRKNRRRLLRRLQESGPVAFASNQGDEEAGKIAGYAISLKRAWLRSRQKISVAMADDRYLAFFRDAVAGGVHPTGCRATTVRTCNEIAAMQILVDNKATTFFHIAVYVPKFEKSGPGGLLLDRAIADAYAAGRSRFDFLAPKHEYKLEYADGCVAVHDYALAVSARGRAYVSGYLGVRRRLKAVVEGLPAPVRQRIGSVISLLKRGSA